VTGSGFIVLASTLGALRVVPVEGLALLLGVDRFMSEARSVTNLIGNGVATLVVSRSEGAFDDGRRAEAVAERAAAREAARRARRRDRLSPDSVPDELEVNDGAVRTAAERA